MCLNIRECLPSFLQRLRRLVPKKGCRVFEEFNPERGRGAHKRLPLSELKVKMNFHYLTLAILLILAVSVMPAENADGQTRLGLHVTQEELNIWKQRRVSGPYQNQWAKIQSRADAFVATPDPRWTARTTGGCWVFNGSDTSPGRTLDRGMRDAGLMYLLTGSAAYRHAVRTALLAQVAVAGTNFATNTSVWCRRNYYEEKYFEIGNWLRRLLYAYDYIRPSLSARR